MGGERWVGTWAASPQAPDGVGLAGLVDQTVRSIVHVSLGGEAVRIRLSNAFGRGPVAFAEASVAVRARGAALVPGTVSGVRFGGSASVVVPAGGEAVSDVVELAVLAGQDLAVSLAGRGATGPATLHTLAGATSYVARGSRAADEGGAAFTTPIGSWLFLAGVDVRSAAPAVVAFGDSLTDGHGSTPDANRRYPDVLARLLGGRMGVLNQGVAGNRLLRGSPVFGVRALDRFDRDVLGQPGVRAVVVLLGINDIGQLPHQLDPAPIVAGLRELAERARAAGLRAIGGTLLPFRGTTIPDFHTEEGEATRQAVNWWIRTAGVFDAVVDLDRAMGAPGAPLRLNPAFDSGDHLHPNDRGYQAMAEAVAAAII
jgi:lysophospholipase L1-like esterase